MSIERDICKAIDIITSKAVATADTGSTILATVIECVNPLTGKYKIDYQGQVLEAYSNDIFNYYAAGAVVNIYLTHGSIDNEKVILSNSKQEKMKYNNVFLSNAALFEPIEKYNYSEKNMKHFSRIVKRSPHFYFNFKFQNDVNDGKVTKITITMTINNKKIIIFEDTQSVLNFKQGLFNQTSENLYWGDVSKLEIKTNNGTQIVDCEIIGIQDIDQLQAYRGVLELNYQKNKINADISLLGHYVSKEELDNFEFYWFIEDLEIKQTNANFNLYGGEGWKCLNNKYQNMWRRGKSEYNLGELTGTFKCVAVMDNFTFSRLITI